MSLRKWKEFAKSKTKLGNKINYVNDLIKQHNIGQETSQESFAKVFKPVTTKLDDVIKSNLTSRIPPQRKRKKQPPEKDEVGIDYMPEVDPYEDMDVEGLIDYGDYVPPQQEKRIAQSPPTYEQSLAEILEENKETYVNPQYPQESPPEYDDDKEIDYTIDDYDLTNKILDDLNLANYEDVDDKLEKITHNNKVLYISKIIKDATYRRNQLRGYKSSASRKYRLGKISEAEKQVEHKRIDNARIVLNEYIKNANNVKDELEKIKGSGIKGRGRKRRGGNVMFFNDANQLLKKLELIIGEIIAGNTSIKMRNMGVNILDTLLKIATINRSQYNKIYNNYFKII